MKKEELECGLAHGVKEILHRLGIITKINANSHGEHEASFGRWKPQHEVPEGT